MLVKDRFTSEARAGIRLLSALSCVMVLSVVSIWPPVEAADDQALDDYNLAVGLYKQERWELATDAFTGFLKKHPKHAKAQFASLYLGLTQVNLKQFEPARKTLREFAKQYPNSTNLSDARYRIAECSYLLGDLKAANSEFTEFLQKHPEDTLNEWALPYLADIQLQLGDAQSALKTYQQAEKKYPDGALQADVAFGLARAYDMVGKKDEAYKRYKDVAADETDLWAPKAQHLLATLDFQAGRYADAAAGYLDLIKRFPESLSAASARLNAGFAYFQAGDFRSAIEQFDQAAREPDQQVTASYWKGVSYRQLNEYKAAAEVLQNAFNANPQSELADQILYQWADCELRQGDNKAALQHFLQLTDGWPKSELADDSLHFAAESALSLGQLDLARKLIERFAKQFPDSGLRLHADLLEGRLLANSGKPADLTQAIAIFRKVLQQTTLDETRELTRFHLARALAQSGANQEALDVARPLVEQVRKEGKDSPLIDTLILVATTELALKNYDAASQAATDYLTLYSDGPQAEQAIATRALAEAHQGDQTKAQFNLTMLGNRFPKSDVLARTTHQVAEIAYNTKKWDWSAELFGQLAKQGKASPYHVLGLSGLGWSRRELKQHAAAAEAFEELVRDDPKNELAAESAYLWGNSLEEAGEANSALAAYAKAFEAYSDSRHGYLAGLQRARLLSRQDRIEEADKAYESLLKAFPKLENRDRLLDEWALLNYEAERFERSDEIFRRLIKDEPTSPLANNARLSLAESDLLAGRIEPAEKEFRDLATSASSDALVKSVALYRLIDISVEREDWKSVEQLARRLLTEFPESPHADFAKLNQADALLRAGQLEEARKQLHELKETENQQSRQAVWFPRVWVLLAEAELRAKNYDAVFATVDNFEKELPESPLLYQAWEIVGRAHKNRAEFTEAREAFQKVISDTSGRRTPTAAKSQFLMAETYLVEKNYQAALLEYLKVDIQYDYPEWRAPAKFQTGMCHEALMEWPKAAKTYQDLIKTFPDSEFAPKASERLKAIASKLK